MVNQWGRDGNFASGSAGSSRSAGSILIPAIVALIIGAGGGYAGARFFSGVSPTDIETRDKRIAELQQTLSEMKFDSKGSDTEMTVLRQRIEDLQGQVDSLTRTKASLQKYADEQATRVNGDAAAEIAALRKTIDEAGDLSNQLNRARKSLKVSELQIIELETTVKDQKSEIAALQARIDQSGSDADSQMKLLSDQVKTLQSALSAAKKQLAGIPDLKRQIADLEDKLAKRADGADAEARKQIDALEAQKRQLQAQLDDALKSAGDATAQARKIADLQKQLDEMAVSLADRDETARQATSDLKAAKATLAKTQKQLGDLKAENDTLAAARSSLEKQVATLTAKVESLMTEKPATNDKPADDAPTTSDDGVTPRDRQEVEKAVADLPGYNRLSADKQENLIGMLERGECVTDSLKTAFGHVSPVALRNLFRDLGGKC